MVVVRRGGAGFEKEDRGFHLSSFKFRASRHHVGVVGEVITETTATGLHVQGHI